MSNLRRLAEAATEGPWEFLPKEAVGGMAIVPMQGPAVVPNAWGTWEPDAAYIAAASPDVILALLDRAEQAESTVEPLTREIIEDRTMFLWGELDDGKGERWLQHDGAGNAWTPDPDVLQLLNLAARAALDPATSEEGDR